MFRSRELQMMKLNLPVANVNNTDPRSELECVGSSKVNSAILRVTHMSGHRNSIGGSGSSSPQPPHHMIADGVASSTNSSTSSRQSLTRQPNRVRLTIVGMSANSDAESEQGSAEAGMDYFLQKPFVYADFAKILEKAMFVNQNDLL
jgi:hypothetical protein